MDKIQDSVLRELIKIIIIAVVIIAGFLSLCVLGLMRDSFAFGCITVVCAFVSIAVGLVQIKRK